MWLLCNDDEKNADRRKKKDFCDWYHGTSLTCRLAGGGYGLEQDGNWLTYQTLWWRISKALALRDDGPELELLYAPA